MTYREKYQQLHPEEDASNLHLDFCPDLLLNDKDIPIFVCPLTSGNNGPSDCCTCWDTEIPSTEVVPPKSEPEAQPAPTPEKNVRRCANRQSPG